MIEMLTAISLLCAVHGTTSPIWAVELSQAECQAYLVDCALEKDALVAPVNHLAACVVARAKRVADRK